MFLVNVNKDEKNARHYDYDFDQYKSYYYNEDKDHHCRLLKIKKKELAKKTLGGNFKLSTALAVFIIFIIHSKYLFISDWLKSPG